MADDAQTPGEQDGRDPWAPPGRGMSLEKPSAGTPPPGAGTTPGIHADVTLPSMPTMPGFGPPPGAPSGSGSPGAAVPPPPPAPAAPPGGYAYPAPASPAMPPGGPVYPGAYPGSGYGYGWPGYSGPPMNGLGTAAMVLGILSICLFFMYGFVSLVLGILAVVFGVKGRRRADRGEASNRGQAQAGFITGIIGIAIGVIVIALIAVGIGWAVNHQDDYGDDGYSAAVPSGPVTPGSAIPGVAGSDRL